MLAVAVSPVGEVVKLSKAFHIIGEMINSTLNNVRVNKYKCKRLAHRRELVMHEIQNLENHEQKRKAARELEFFDNDFIGHLTEFNKHSALSPIWKMLFRKSDTEIFEQMFEDLEKIRYGYTTSMPDFVVVRNEDSSDVVNDFQSDKEILKAHTDDISHEDKVVIKKNFVEYVEIAKSFASISSSSVSTDIPLSLSNVNVVLDEVADILNDINSEQPSIATLLAIESTQGEEVVEPVMGRDSRSSTTIEERETRITYWAQWFRVNVPSIRGSRWWNYGSILFFIDNDVTNEDRLIEKLKTNPDWLTEKQFDVKDANDIKKYFINQGKLSFKRPLTESHTPSDCVQSSDNSPTAAIPPPRVSIDSMKTPTEKQSDESHEHGKHVAITAYVDKDSGSKNPLKRAKH